MIARRTLLSACAASLFGAEQHRAPSVRTRYLDAATEFEFQRYTEPAVSCFLPRSTARAFARRGNFLLYASDRGGSLDAWALDLKSSEHKKLTEGASLDADSLTLTPDDRNFAYAAAGQIWLCPSGGLRPKALWKAEGELLPALALIPDGPSALALDFAGGKTALHRIPLVRGGAQKVTEIEGRLTDPAPRPRRASVLLREEAGGLWLAPIGPGRAQKLRPASGRVMQAVWAPDGRTIYYLLNLEEPGRAHQMRELNPDTGEDKLVAMTTQFACFGANRDASVFCGASESKAQPYVLLLVRSVRRELTICEHKSSTPHTVRPMFTPDSQRIFFQSDREGKSVLYGMTVDKLVEKTEDEDAEPSEKP